jgi:hypothetical protein
VLIAALLFSWCCGAFAYDLSRDDVRTRHYTGASVFVYAYFDIYWIAVAIAAARVGWGIV